MANLKKKNREMFGHSEVRNSFSCNFNCTG